MNPCEVYWLTRKLFDMLKPGGRAVFGNFLKPRGENLHRITPVHDGGLFGLEVDLSESR